MLINHHHPFSSFAHSGSLFKPTEILHNIASTASRPASTVESFLLEDGDEDCEVLVLHTRAWAVHAVLSPQVAIASQSHGDTLLVNEQLPNPRTYRLHVHRGA